MRTLAALAAAVGLAAIAGPAAACLPPPPPNWDAWLGDPSVDIFLGRVESVETLPPVEEGSVIITPGVAHVRSVETIQGQPASDTARATGALGVAYRTIPAPAPLCLNYLSFKPGDLVVVVRGSVFGRTVNDPPALVAYFEKHQ
jgi:hypothetical protein